MTDPLDFSGEMCELLYATTPEALHQLDNYRGRPDEQVHSAFLVASERLFENLNTRIAELERRIAVMDAGGL